MMRRLNAHFQAGVAVIIACAMLLGPQPTLAFMMMNPGSPFWTSTVISSAKRHEWKQELSATSTSTPPSVIDTTTKEQSYTAHLPSWEELNVLLSNQPEYQQQSSSKVLLYRDTNGWCPFCERVWVALRAKNISYDEELISLNDKPDWYKRLVPSALVPAVLFYGDDDSDCGSNNKVTERKLVWESLDILKALDDEFPSTQRMVWDTIEYKQALVEVEELNRAGFLCSYGFRNETLTDEDREENKQAFLNELNKLDAALAESKGPFRLGAEFSGIDAIMIPMLERWRYQMKLSSGIDVMEGRPNVQKWFHAMDSFSPYSHKVAGDEYSWTAVNSQFLRYFGGGEDKPEVKQQIEKSERLAEELRQSFSEAITQTEEQDEKIVFEVAQKLISNREAVIRDCTNPNPKSQKELPRGQNQEIADCLLRFVASILLKAPASSPSQLTREMPLPQEIFTVSSEKAEVVTQEASLILRTVAARLCVPRDMSAPAAKLFRKVLTILANRLDTEEA